MAPTWVWVIVGLGIAGLIALVFFWYEFRRARESFKHIDYSKLRDWDKDEWND